MVQLIARIHGSLQQRNNKAKDKNNNKKLRWMRPVYKDNIAFLSNQAMQNIKEVKYVIAHVIYFFIQYISVHCD